WKIWERKKRNVLFCSLQMYLQMIDVKFLIITWHLLVVVTASYDVGEIADNKSSTASSK
ncbi:hypothetical protein TNIN_410461, partial [Trichonephila inaurata madagascariensis]